MTSLESPPASGNRYREDRLHLPILDGDREVSHISGRLDLPERDGAPPFAILYLHGFGSSHEGEKAEFFRDRALAAGLPVCAFDFQGHGRSGGGMLDATLSRNLADVERVHGELRRRGFERVVLLGSSMGGLTGLWYAALHPEAIAYGLFLAPAVGLRQSLELLVGPQGMERWREEGKQRFVNELGEWDVGWGFVEDLEDYAPSRLWQAFRTPSLLLQGRRDDRVLWRKVAEFAVGCDFDDIELHLFADGDHRMTDRKERLWSLMHGFLRDRGEPV